MTTIHRTTGDFGAKARIQITGLKDADDTAITTGTVTLRAWDRDSNLFENAMTHDTDGTWYVDPVDGDLDTAGIYSLEVTVDGSQATIPAKEPWTLKVRAQGTAP